MDNGSLWVGFEAVMVVRKKLYGAAAINLAAI